MLIIRSPPRHLFWCLFSIKIIFPVRKVLKNMSNTVKNKGEKISKFKKGYYKFRLKIAQAFSAVGCTLITSTMLAMSCFAGDDNIIGSTPADVDTGKLGSIIGIVFWIVRIIIALVGIVPAIIKIVQGQADENPRDRNSGIAAAGVSAAAIGVSFAIEKWFD